MLVIKSEQIAKKQTKEFFRLWNSIPDKYLYKIPELNNLKLE